MNFTENVFQFFYTYVSILLLQVLIFSWDGTVSLMNTDTSQTVYCFCTPPSHAVARPWQPVFTMDSMNCCLLLRGG